ncbi:MAG TPA: FAD-dependent oxidoreductase [Polyangiaceae bacterium]|jgi:glycine oxidase
MRIVIIGAGVMGCATALALSDRDAGEIVVLERAVPGAEASSAAAGILGAQLEARGAAEAAVFRRARDGYRAWSEQLRAETGIDVGYKHCGALQVAFDPGGAAELGERVAGQTREGLSAELLDARGARAVEPALSDRVVAAAHFPDEAQVEPPVLLRALVAATARRPHVSVRSGVTVRGLLVEHDRCVGVQLERGELRADATVLAAGSWSSLVPGLPASLPEVKPIRGQLVQLDERPPRVRMIVFGDHGYVVPRGDGRVVCGSTMEDVGFRREVTAAGLASILAKALALVPSLGEAQIGPAWSSFRPGADAPLVGASQLSGLFLATGHHRNGILLARETGERVADALLH